MGLSLFKLQNSTSNGFGSLCNVYKCFTQVKFIKDYIEWMQIIKKSSKRISYPSQVRLKYGEQHQHEKSNLVHKHSQNIYPMFRRILELGQECPAHSRMNQRKIQNITLHSVDRLIYNQIHQLDYRPPRNCKPLSMEKNK